MRWTPYLDECLRYLEEKKDCPTDGLLVYLVRVQLICNRASTSPLNDTFGDVVGVPMDFFIKTLKAQLQELERSIPPDLKRNGKSISPHSNHLLIQVQRYCNSRSSTQPSVFTSTV
jgi:hypothetical protein